MSKKVHNPHDKFVRETFADAERVFRLLKVMSKL